MEGVGSYPKTDHMAERLLEDLARPYEIDEREVYATASAGIVVVEDKITEDTEDLLRYADTALQAAKAGGHSRYVIFDEAMREAAEWRIALDTDLRKATEWEEFVLYYQPLLSLHTNTIVGVEALVRWKHPQRGLLPPGQFIAHAEQSGLIVPIGEWVLREACRWAKTWRERHLSEPPVTVSVNLSAKQMEHPGLFDEIEATLEETGLDPRSLILEITEGVLADGAESISGALGSIKAYGIRLAVDDFGTGYSSLSYLSRFPVDIVKIDRSFVGNLPQKSPGQEASADEKLISGIIDLAHGQEMAVVAEGVESTYQLEQLREMECDMIQGYCFSRPLPDEETIALMENRLR